MNTIEKTAELFTIKVKMAIVDGQEAMILDSEQTENMDKLIERYGEDAEIVTEELKYELSDAVSNFARRIKAIDK